MWSWEFIKRITWQENQWLNLSITELCSVFNLFFNCLRGNSVLLKEEEKIDIWSVFSFSDLVTLVSGFWHLSFCEQFLAVCSSHSPVNFCFGSFGLALGNWGLFFFFFSVPECQPFCCHIVYFSSVLLNIVLIYIPLKTQCQL